MSTIGTASANGTAAGNATLSVPVGNGTMPSIMQNGTLPFGAENGTLPLGAHNGTLPFGAESAVNSAGTTSAGTVLPPSVEFSWSGYFEAIGIMLILLAALWGVLWLVRKYARFRFMPAPGSFPRNGLHIESQLPLGPRKGLFVVRFLNERLLLGVTDQSISLLKATPLHDPDRYEPDPDQPDSGKPDATKSSPDPHNSVDPRDAQAFARLLAAEQGNEGTPDVLPRKP